jgi:Flp pilus assembly pilin Flp
MLPTVSHVLIRSPWLSRLVGRESGQNLIEYGMLAALIVLIAIGAVTAAGGQVHAALWEPTAASF